jgi:hypothetical protein
VTITGELLHQIGVAIAIAGLRIECFGLLASDRMRLHSALRIKVKGLLLFYFGCATIVIGTLFGVD